MTTLTNAGIFLVGLIFDLYIIILMLRLLMQKLGASYYNPISQLTIRLTNLFVLPLRKVIPGYWGIDFSIVVLMLLLEGVEAFLLTWMRFHFLPRMGGILVIAIAALGDKLLNLYFYSIIIRVLMSWLAGLQRNPIAEIVFLLTEPLLSRVRRVIPSLAGLDFSPLIALIVLQLLSILVLGPLMGMGTRLALF